MTHENTSTWPWLKKVKKDLRCRNLLHMNRVENSAGSGFPDVEGFKKNRGQFFMELKCEHRPVRGGLIRFHVRDGQVEWHRRRREVGGRSWFLLQVGITQHAERYLVDGRFGPELQNHVDEGWLKAHCEVRRLGLSTLDPYAFVAAAAGL